MDLLLKMKNSIDRGVISLVYVFGGEEEYLKDQLVQQLKGHILSGDADDFNFELISEPIDLEQVISSAEQLPVFADKRLVVVKGKNVFGEANTPGEQELVKYLENPNPSTCLVFVTDKIDSRRKVTKLVKTKGEVYNCAPLKSDELAGWIRAYVKANKRTISGEAIELLMAAGDSLYMIQQELNKVMLFSSEQQIDLATLDQTISKTASLNVFKITELAAEKQGGPAVKLYRETVATGEYPLKILALLGRSFRQLLRVKLLSNQTNMGAEGVSREVKVPSFVGKRLLSQQRAFSEHQLCEILVDIKDSDWRIKTGQIDPVVAVELLLFKIAKK